MIDATECDLIAHALGHESVNGEVTFKVGPSRNHFITTPDSADDEIWKRLAARGLAHLVPGGTSRACPNNTWTVTSAGRDALRLYASRDAMGNRIIAGETYYIEDSRQVVGNCVLWWGKDRSGYTCTLDDAGIYTGLEAARIVGMRSEDTDHAWPTSFVDAHVYRHVRCEPLNEARAQHPKRDRPPTRRRRDARA